MSILHKALLAIALLLAASATANAYLTITSVNDGDTFSIGTAFYVDWNDSEGSASDNRILVLLRCSASWLATEYCDQVSKVQSLPQVGHQAFTGSMDLNDGAFYRFQLLNAVTMQLATSGTFTFLPAPVEVDTT